MYKLEKKDNSVYIYEVVKGLKSEAERVIGSIKKINFDVGAITISEEELEGLEMLIKGGEELDIEPNLPEQIYSENLSEYGEVSLPPPSYVSFLKYCRENDIDLVAVDMDEDHYTMAYCDHVTGTQWIMQSFREKRLKTKNFKSNNPRDFALEWDKVINKLKGFQELEKHREKIIAKNISRLSRRGKMVALMEIERAQGVAENMQDMGWDIISHHGK